MQRRVHTRRVSKHIAIHFFRMDIFELTSIISGDDDDTVVKFFKTDGY